MKRLTHERVNGIKAGYWSPAKKQELVDRLAEYEDIGLDPDEIQDLKDSNRWISISERLPKRERKVYLVTYKTIGERRYVKASYLRYTGTTSFCCVWEKVNGEVIAWMPLPEPYASEGGSYGK